MLSLLARIAIKRRMHAAGYYVGLATMFAIHTVTSDLLGQQAAIEAATNHWIPWYITSPIAVGLLVLSGFISHQHKRRVDRLFFGDESADDDEADDEADE